MGDGRHRASIVAVAVPVIIPDVYASGVWVVACLPEADGCIPSSDDIDLNGLVPPPPSPPRSDAVGAFPVIASV